MSSLSLGSDHLDFQIWLDEKLDELEMFLHFMACHTKFIEPAKREKAGDMAEVTAEFEQAIADITPPIPLAFVQSVVHLKSQAFRDKGKHEELVEYWKTVDTSSFTESVKDFFLGQVGNVFTEMLRPCDGSPSSDAKNGMIAFLMHCVQAKLHEAVTEQAKLIAMILDFDSHTTEEIRQGLDVLVKPTSHLHGLFKIFAALGRNFITEASAALVVSGKDGRLEGHVQRARDLFVSFKVEMQNVATSCNSNILVEGKQIVDNVVHAILQSSRFLKEREKPLFDSIASSIIEGMTTLNISLQSLLKTSVWDRFQKVGVAAECSVVKLSQNIVLIGCRA